MAWKRSSFTNGRGWKFYQNGSKEAKDNKIYLIVKREDDGRIKTVRQITMEEVMARIAHLN